MSDQITSAGARVLRAELVPDPESVAAIARALTESQGRALAMLHRHGEAVVSNQWRARAIPAATAASLEAFGVAEPAPSRWGSERRVRLTEFGEAVIAACLKKTTDGGSRLFDGEMTADLELWLGDAFESWVPSMRQLIVRDPSGVEHIVSAGDRVTQDGHLLPNFDVREAG